MSAATHAGALARTLHGRQMTMNIEATNPVRVARLSSARLPTRLGDFEALVFADQVDGTEPVALVHGDVASRDAPLVRVHSECWTGDVVGSLRCDCGEQLGRALTAITAQGAGVLLYLRQEGRGVGLANKVRAYGLQDGGLDTVDANAALGLPIDGRDYGGAAAILIELGLRRVRLMTNNPNKVAALEAAGIQVVERVPVTALPNIVNSSYLQTKITRLGHEAQQRAPRPPVTIHYAQTLDGRLATRTGDSQWISAEPATRFAHRLRASHAAVMVGAGTVIADDPRLTTRLVPGPSPVRIVVDSTLRVPPASNVITDGAAPTILATTDRATHERSHAFALAGADILVLPATPAGGVDLGALLDELGRRGFDSVLVEGGAGLITALLREHRVRRLVVTIAPMIVGAGIEAVGDLDIGRLRDALAFRRASFSQVGPDLIFDGELEPWSEADA